MNDPVKVDFAPDSTLSLAAYFLRDLLRTSVSTPEGRALSTRLRGHVLFEASGMQTTIAFSPDAITLSPGNVAPEAKAIGDLNSLLQIAIGKPFLGFLLSGKVRVSGNLILLLRTLKLLRSAPNPTR